MSDTPETTVYSPPNDFEAECEVIIDQLQAAAEQTEEVKSVTAFSASPRRQLRMLAISKLLEEPEWVAKMNEAMDIAKYILEANNDVNSLYANYRARIERFSDAIVNGQKRLREEPTDGLVKVHAEVSLFMEDQSRLINHLVCFQGAVSSFTQFAKRHQTQGEVEKCSTCQVELSLFNSKCEKCNG